MFLPVTTALRLEFITIVVGGRVYPSDSWAIAAKDGSLCESWSKCQNLMPIPGACMGGQGGEGRWH